MEFLFTEPGSWISVLGSVALVVAGHIANKYVIPFLKVGKRQKYAEYIARIADEVTDDIRSKYPQRQWLKHLDEAVDQLIMICGVTPEIARRAVRAAAARK
ncbi:MAG: hypothetical protein AB1744_08335 [Candidatus Zixiibacteriota bacterium]